jgi:hypothetical protein
MPRQSATEAMMAFVQEYLDGERERLFFDLDFSYTLMKYYPRMERANRDLAECFNFYLTEEGFDRSEGLSDSEHKKLIRRQFNEFKSVMKDEFTK